MGLPLVLFWMNQLQALRETGLFLSQLTSAQRPACGHRVLGMDQSVHPDNNPMHHDCYSHFTNEKTEAQGGQPAGKKGNLLHTGASVMETQVACSWASGRLKEPGLKTEASLVLSPPL